MKRIGTLAVAGALALATSVIAIGATYSDPTGDNCKTYLGIGQFCGSDIAGAEDTVDSTGLVHLKVTYVGGPCVGNGFSTPFGMAFEVYPASVTAPSISPLAVISEDPTGLVQIRYGNPAVTAPVVSSKSVAGNLTTLDVTIPAAAASTVGTSFGWLASNTCIGELPNEASDIAPNTGLFTHSVAATTSPPTTTPTPPAPGGPAPNAFSIGAPVATPKGTILRVNVPGPGTVTIAGTKRTKALRARADRAGVVALTVKPTAAARRLLATKPQFTATVTVTFQPVGGTPRSTKTRIKLIR